jgi:hypothetical protein
MTVTVGTGERAVIVTMKELGYREMREFLNVEHKGAPKKMSIEKAQHNINNCTRNRRNGNLWCSFYAFCPFPAFLREALNKEKCSTWKL